MPTPKIRLRDFPLQGPPERREGNVDMSHLDVPYLVVPALTNKPIVHLAVECTGVDWSGGSSTRIYAWTRCGREVYADRRSMFWSVSCKRCIAPDDAVGDSTDKETTPDAT